MHWKPADYKGCKLYHFCVGTWGKTPRLSSFFYFFIIEISIQDLAINNIYDLSILCWRRVFVAVAGIFPTRLCCVDLGGSTKPLNSIRIICYSSVEIGSLLLPFCCVSPLHHLGAVERDKTDKTQIFSIRYMFWQE